MKGGRALYAEFIKGVDMFALRLSSVIDNIRSQNPETSLTVWSNEDIPLVWPELLQAVVDYAPGTVLDNEGDLRATLGHQADASLHPLSPNHLNRDAAAGCIDISGQVRTAAQGQRRGRDAGLDGSRRRDADAVVRAGCGSHCQHATSTFYRTLMG